MSTTRCHSRNNRNRNNHTLQSPSYVSNCTRTMTKFSSTFDNSRQELPVNNYLSMGKKPSSVSYFSSIASSSSSEEEEEEEDFSSFSIAELERMTIKSLQQLQEESSSSSHRAQAILEHLLDRMKQDDKEDLSNIHTSLIDSWMKYQSSVMDDIRQQATIIKEVQSSTSDGQNDNENSTTLLEQEKSLSQRLQYNSLREIHSAAASMTSILESMDDPTSHHFVAILKAWANTCQIAHEMEKTKLSYVVGVPQRAQLILNSMGPNPTVEAYNEVIKAWAYSSEYLRGTMAEQVSQKVQYPTGESFKVIMRAHAWSKESRSAFHATGHFMRMMRLLEAGRIDSEPPTIDDYHILCRAWTDAGDKNSSSKVYSVLQIMETAYQKGHINFRADLQCYRDALITMSRRHNVEDVGELADVTIKEMKDQMMHPDTECYRSAILAWKHVAMSRDSPFPEQAIKRTQELLREMTLAYHRTNQVLIQPTTEDYNNVLHAMTLSKTPNAASYAEGLFKTLKEESTTIGGPDAQSYQYMLGIWRNSRSPIKFTHAQQLLQEARENRSSEESIVDVFTSFVQVCGAPNFSNKKDIQERTKIMTMALRTLEDMRKLGLTPNSDTYTALVEACDHLLPANGQERQSALENIFRRACKEGFVNQSLLEHFKSAASSYLYAKLVVSKSLLMEDLKIVPESWTRNVKGYREGKKVMPLSIHGNFTFTKAAAEYRMRKLRRRTNQKLLQGGRLKNMKNSI
jgi:hypothetical protein